MYSDRRLPRQIGWREGVRGASFVAIVFALILVPTNDVVVLQFATLACLSAIIWVAGFLHKNVFVVFLLCLLPVVFIPNVSILGGSIELAKPVFSMAALLAILAIDRRMHRRYLEYFIIAMAGVFAFFILAKVAKIDGIVSLYRVSDQIDLIHLDRFTAPFLYAGDFGLAALYLVFLCLAAGGRKNLLLAAFFVFCLLLSQSKLALAGLPAAYFFYGARGKRALATVVALAAGAITFAYFDAIIERLPYVARFFDNYDHYLTSSKRAEEFLFIYNNYESLFFTGTNEFVLSRNLRTAESSVVSYIVKTGFASTILLWSVIAYVFFKTLKFGLVQFSLLFFFALFAAPLDRPKLSIVVVLCIAGISRVSRNEEEFAPRLASGRRHELPVRAVT